MKALLTENHKQEISKVFGTKAKKNIKKIFKIIEKKKYTISILNEDILKQQCYFDKNVHIHYLSDSGHLLNGRSDKIYLSDCISRLHQNVENLSKTLYGHKVHINKKTGEERITTRKAAPKNHTWSIELFSQLSKDSYSHTSVLKENNIEAVYTFEYKSEIVINSKSNIRFHDQYKVKVDLLCLLPNKTVLKSSHTVPDVKSQSSFNSLSKEDLSHFLSNIIKKIQV